MKTLLLIWIFTALPAQAQAHNLSNIGFLQVEGMILGFYPSLGDGIRVSPVNGQELKFESGNRCFEITRVERAGVAFSGVSFEQEMREDVRNKLTGLMGYPGVSSKELQEDWLRSANGLAADYYRDNLAKPPGDNAIQLLFVPVVLAPKPMQVARTDWTAEAKRILDTQGWPALEQFCGSHFVEAIGEEDYVVYSIRVDLPGKDQRFRFENVRLDRHNQSPGLVLNNLFRMNQRFEFEGPGNFVTVDVLAVGGKPDDVKALRNALAGQDLQSDIENAKDATVSRTRLSCPASKLEPCQQLAQTFLDYQFGRLEKKGYQPTFAPVRFRIAPLKYLKVMNY